MHWLHAKSPELCSILAFEAKIQLQVKVHVASSRLSARNFTRYAWKVRGTERRRLAVIRL